MTEIEIRIVDILDKLRPFLISEGGDLQFIKYEDHVVYIQMMGACSNCEMLDYTLKDGIELALKESIPEIHEVINVRS